jgi:hypothetical protein
MNDRAQPAPPLAEPWRRVLRPTLALACGIYAAVATFPGASFTVPGLDGSWRIEINRLFTERLFGSQAAFTYGPLGLLIYPTDELTHVLAASAVRFVQQVALAISVGALVLSGRRLGALVLLATLIAGSALGIQFEYQLFLVVPWLASIPLRGGRGGWLALASAIAGTALFAKTSVGLGMIAACGVSAALLLGRRSPGARRTVACSLLLGGAAILVSGATGLRSLRELPDWIDLSLRIASGYDAVMGLDGERLQRMGSIATMVAWSGAALWVARRRSPAGDLALVLSAPVFLAFKHAVTRADVSHDYAMVSFAIPALGLVLTRVERRRDAIAVGLALAIALVSAAPTARYFGVGRWAGLQPIVSGRRGWANLREWAAVPREARRQRALLEQAIAADRVPGLRERVAGRTAAVLPWELSYCRANELHCVANPTLQLYSAYSSVLDARTAQHFLAPGAPEVVLLEDRTIDGRHVLLDTPATLQPLIEHYQVSSRDAAPWLLFLEKRSSPLAASRRVIGRSEGRREEWMAVPEAQGLLFARVELDLSAAGRLRKAFYKLGPVHLDLEYQDGSAASFRIPADNARNGLIVSNLDRGLDGLRAALDRRAISAPVRVRFAGRGVRAFREPFRVTWEELPAAATRRPAWLGRSPDSDALVPRTVPARREVLAVDELEVEGDGNGGRMRVAGWAIDPLAARPAAGVLVEVAGKTHWIAGGLPRDDVAAALCVPAYARSGYRGSIDLSGVPRGRHDVIFKVVSEDRLGYYGDLVKEIVIK